MGDTIYLSKRSEDQSPRASWPKPIQQKILVVSHLVDFHPEKLGKWSNLNDAYVFIWVWGGLKPTTRELYMSTGWNCSVPIGSYSPKFGRMKQSPPCPWLIQANEYFLRWSFQCFIGIFLGGPVMTPNPPNLSVWGCLDNDYNKPSIIRIPALTDLDDSCFMPQILCFWLNSP